MARYLTKPSKANTAKKRWTQEGEPEGLRPLTASQKPLASHSHSMDSRGWTGPKASKTQRNQEMNPFLSSPVLAQNVQSRTWDSTPPALHVYRHQDTQEAPKDLPVVQIFLFLFSRQF